MLRGKGALPDPSFAVGRVDLRRSRAGVSSGLRHRDHQFQIFGGGFVATVSEARATRSLPRPWGQGLIGELWAEFFGCFILLSFGDGVVAMLWALVGSGRTDNLGPLQS